MPDFIYNECPICKQTKYAVIGRSNLGNLNIAKGEDSKIVKCNHCKTIYAHPLPVWTSEDFSILYGNADTYFTQSEKWQYIRENEIVDYRYRLISKYIRTKNKKLLEAGAGIQAYMAKYLNKRAWDVSVQEPSPDYIDILKKNYPSFHFIDSAFLDIDSKNKYSVIYLDSVMEHVANPVDYLKKGADLLEEGGIFYFISPNEHSFRNWALTLLKKFRGQPVCYLCPYTEPYHLIGFSKKGIKILAEKAGLKLVKHLRKCDYTWFHTLERKNIFIKYPLALFVYILDIIGWGNNQEVILMKSTPN